eukprot:778769-Amphidinium_carterae.2
MMRNWYFLEGLPSRPVQCMGQHAVHRLRHWHVPKPVAGLALITDSEFLSHHTYHFLSSRLWLLMVSSTYTTASLEKQ